MIDLHGTLDAVSCLDCGGAIERAVHQRGLRALNPDWTHAAGHAAPDGDVDLVGARYESFRVPGCPDCGGILKPTVVFFGESVPRERVERVRGALAPRPTEQRGDSEAEPQPTRSSTTTTTR